MLLTTQHDQHNCSPSRVRRLYALKSFRMRNARIRWCFYLGILPIFLCVGVSSALADAEPALLTLLLDNSGSIQPEDLGRVQTLTRNLLASLPAGCEIAVYKFNDDSKLLLERTSQMQQIERAIGSLQREGRFTALYDALFDASQYLENQPTRKRAILLLTDGKNEGGQTSLAEGLEIAIRQRIPVFTVGMGRAINQRVLRRIAEQTGGVYTDISAATGQGLAKAIQQAFASAPRALPEPVQASKSPQSPTDAGSPSDRRTFWLIGLLALTGILGGLLIWWTAQRPKPPAPISSSDPKASDPTASDPTATAWAPRQEPAEDLGTVKAPLSAQVPRTVRIEIGGGSLIVREGNGTGLIFPVLPVKATLLGRNPSAEFPVEDPTVSFEHCQIVPESGSFVIRDLNSTNGTFVNGASVKEHRLQNGDLIQIGNTKLEFTNSEESR